MLTHSFMLFQVYKFLFKVLKVRFDPLYAVIIAKLKGRHRDILTTLRSCLSDLGHVTEGVLNV